MAATINDYTYDVGVGNDTPPVTATHMLGRLATASWGDPSSLAGGKRSSSYDGFGRISAKVFTDTTVPPNKVYAEKHDFNDDGSEKTLHLLLDDNGFKEETVDYAYDLGGPYQVGRL